MYTSQKFKNIGSHTIKLLMPLIFNQKILRYIKYLDNSPLSPDKLDINDNLIETKDIILTPFDPSVLSEISLKLFVFPQKGLIKGGITSQPISKDTYWLVICCPLSKWVIEGEGEFRPFLIASEIAKEIDGKKISGIGDVNILDWDVSKVNDSYAALRLLIEVNSSNISLGS